MGLRFDNLPEELIATIFRHARHSASSSQWWDCLRVCRQWYRIGLPLLNSVSYAATVIVESDHRRHLIPREKAGMGIHVLCDLSLQNSKLFLSELRSLTLHICHIRIAAPFRPVSGDFFDILITTVQMATKLSTLSLKFADVGWDFPHEDVPAIPQSKIARFVASLPITVVNLEIDTVFMDLPPDQTILCQDQELHLCYAISQVFPRLQHLRLRVSHVCSTMFDFLRSKDCHTSRIRSMTFWTPRVATPDIQSFIEIQSFQDTFERVTESCKDQFPELKSRMLVRNKVFFCQRPDLEDCWIRSNELRYFRSSRAIVENPLPQTPLIPPECEQHAKIVSPKFRYYAHPLDVPLTEAYIKDWYIEGEARWLQNRHRGCRRPCLVHSNTIPIEYIDRGDTPFPCLYRRCTGQFRRINHLHWHSEESHGLYPHRSITNGAIPCPSYGCDRVGIWGFFKQADLNEHILDHHRLPCTLASQPHMPYMSKRTSRVVVEDGFKRPSCSRGLSLLGTGSVPNRKVTNGRVSTYLHG